MIKLKYIFVFIVIICSSSYSQTFNNLDSLLSKNFETVNNRDSISYLTLINQEVIFNGKKIKNKSDSLKILNPFTDSFAELIDNLTDMTAGGDFSVKYSNFELIDNSLVLPENGKIRIHAIMIVNGTIILKMPMVIVAKNSMYSIQTPMSVMFLEGQD